MYHAHHVPKDSAIPGEFGNIVNHLENNDYTVKFYNQIEKNKFFAFIPIQNIYPRRS